MNSAAARWFLGAFAALALILVIEWLPAPDPAVPAPPLAAHAARGDADAHDLAAKDTALWAQTITRRPLFTVGRRPSKTASTARAVASTGLPRLSGIMITPSGRRAIFMPDGGKPMTLAEGASLDDSTIRQIRPDRVVLSGPKGETVLRPAYDNNRVVPPPILPPPSFTPQGIAAQPGFPATSFVPPGFTPAGANGPLGVNGNPPPPQQAGNADNNDDNNDGTSGQPAVPPPAQPYQPPAFPGIRGPFIPRGRQQ